MKYLEIIEQQKSCRHLLNRSISPPLCGFTIVIKGNKIQEIVKGPGWVHPTRLQQYSQLFQNCLEQHSLPDANININLQDHPIIGVFNFCRNLNSYGQFLLPNHRFTNDDILPIGITFDKTIEYLRSKWTPYESRISSFYTNCIPHPSKVDYFKYALNNKDMCKGYVYGGTVHKYVQLDTDFIDKLKASGLAGETHMPFEEHLKYKYVIYNDGNALSDRMRLLLNTDAIIIRKSSPYEEFYTYMLKPHVNYIDYTASDELLKIFNNLEHNTELTNTIRNNNKDFVDTYLQYDVILEYIANLMNTLYI
jgi:hypothetical protein